jgi:hypothetical protein
LTELRAKEEKKQAVMKAKEEKQAATKQEMRDSI